MRINREIEMSRIMFAAGILVIIMSAILLAFAGTKEFWSLVAISTIIGILLIVASKLKIRKA
jgi:hypothetical protein